jgi:hypothetical protein
MPALPTFQDYMAATGPVFLTNPKQVINEVQKRNYILSRLMKSNNMKDLVQGGNKIKDTILVGTSGSYRHYVPGSPVSYQRRDVTRTIEVDWRFSMASMVWSEHEIELNIGDNPSLDQAKVAYKNLKRIKEQDLWTEMLNGFENDLWATPNAALMEDASGTDPYSLPTHITEIDFFPASVGEWRGRLPIGFSTLMGQSPDVVPEWSNQVVLYDKNRALTALNDAPATVVTSANAIHANGASSANREVHSLFRAFDDMFLRCGYQAPDTQQEYFTQQDLNQQLIITSRAGQNDYRAALRAANDRLVSAQDAAYGSPSYSGIPVRYASNLDTAAIYPRQASGAAVADTLTARNGIAQSACDNSGTEFGTDTVDKGARYYWVPAQFFRPVIHARRYMKVHKPLNSKEQPFDWAQNVDCWWNLFCRSRRRCGIIAPMRTT